MKDIFNHYNQIELLHLKFNFKENLKITTTSTKRS
jgi:hypothetical protein